MFSSTDLGGGGHLRWKLFVPDTVEVDALFFLDVCFVVTVFSRIHVVLLSPLKFCVLSMLSSRKPEKYYSELWLICPRGNSPLCFNWQCFHSLPSPPSSSTLLSTLVNWPLLATSP